MHRRKFIGLAVGGAVAATGAAAYLLSDRRNVVRSDLAPDAGAVGPLHADEGEILLLASLAPSGHNAQPWFVEYLGPFHWIIGNDHRRWLPAVDPQQRETILSLGAFLENLELAAAAFGYVCRWTPRAATRQDARVMEVRLTRTGSPSAANLEDMRRRRTVRTGFAREVLNPADVVHLIADDAEFIRYLPATGDAARFINAQTIAANRLQAYREPAQQELADWVRFSNADARRLRDGLTTGGMEIAGLSGWAVRNFYGKASVLKNDFRERGIAQARAEVEASAGWMVIASRDATVDSLLETGRRMQRLFLKVRGRGIGLHPMTQILEEPLPRETLGAELGIGDPVQFLLRVGYVKNYPPPVSLRRPVAWFLRRGAGPART